MLSSNAKFFALAVLLITAFNTSFGQQDPIYTQSSFNILQFNPAYTGSKDAISCIATYRHQWSGIEGAPRSFNVGVHSPIGKNISLGLNFVHDKVGVTKYNAPSIMAAYRVNFKSSFLQLGLQGTLELYQNEYASIATTTPQDPSFSENENVTLGNFGLGAYYAGEKLYCGLSLPTLLNHASYYSSQGSGQERYHHVYGLIGYIVPINKEFVFRPSIVTRWSSGNTLYADINATAIFNDFIWMGLSYKTTNVMAILCQLHFKNEMYIGYSYDIGLSDNSILRSSTHEVIIGIDVFSSKKRFASPRYF